MDKKVNSTIKSIFIEENSEVEAMKKLDEWLKGRKKMKDIVKQKEITENGKYVIHILYK